MRDYLSISNLGKAAGLAALMTLMSVGRLVQGQKSLAFYIPVTFCAMMFIAGAVAAWGRRAGMAGIVTDRRTLCSGVALALLLALLALPVYVWGLDAILRNALRSATSRTLLNLSYPATVGGCLALMLWSAGFQTMFFVAAPMSLFARLTNRQSVALGLTLAVRFYVMHRQMTEAGVSAAVPLFYGLALATTLAGGLLFARYGLAPAMLFAAALDLRLLLYV